MFLIPGDMVMECSLFGWTWNPAGNVLLNKFCDDFVLVFVNDRRLVHPNKCVKMNGTTGLVLVTNEPRHDLTQRLSL